MEEFKTFEQLLKPDERWSYFVSKIPVSGEMQPVTLKGRYEAVAEIVLPPSVPEAVASEFNTAKMLCVYAWLYYPLHSVAELKAYATVELALKLAFPSKQKAQLKVLLDHAVEEKFLMDSGFSHVEVDESDPQKYSRTLPDLIPRLRNAYAHGDPMLLPWSLFVVRNCAEIIQQLFEPIAKRSS